MSGFRRCRFRLRGAKAVCTVLDMTNTDFTLVSWTTDIGSILHPSNADQIPSTETELQIYAEVRDDSRIVPVVGAPATMVWFTDRHAYTVTRVGPSGKVLWARRCRAIRTDSNGMSECQSYRYEEDPTAPEYRFFATGSGRWNGKAGTLVVGVRREYHDFNF